MSSLKFKNENGEWQTITGTSSVVSFNGRAGAIKPRTGDYTAEMVGADEAGSADNALNDAKTYTDEHNVDIDAHEDIRGLITELTTRLNTLANSDDTTLDQMAEVVSYIKNNKSLIDGITANKINVSDIINNLTTNVSDKPLSAAQGVALKALIDAIVVPSKTSQLTNDSGFITGFTETDPTVPAWAKAASKPSYTASEVGADPSGSAAEALEEVKAYTDEVIVNAGAGELESHITNMNNPHNVLASQIGAICADEYIWKRTITSERIVFGDAMQLTLNTYNAYGTSSATTYYYASSISYDQSVGLIKFDSYSSVTVNYNNYTDANVLNGKYFVVSSDFSNGYVQSAMCYYADPSAPAATHGETWTNGTPYRSVYKTAQTVMYAKNASQLDAVTSMDENAYPHNAELDGIYYEFCGKFLKSIMDGGARVQTGSYVGTGTYGASNYNSLTFNFVPKLVMVMQSGYGSLLSTDTIPSFVWFGQNGMSSTNQLAFTCSDATLNWSCTGSANHQFNNSSTVYYWVAIG